MKILTLNVFMRPTLINSYYNSFKSYWNGKMKFNEIFYGDYKDHRFDKLLDHIKASQYDIVCLQELFNDGISTRVNRMKEFSTKNNYYLYIPMDIKLCRTFTSSGLCILSKYPMTDTNFIEYNTFIHFPNVLSNCGFIHTKVKVKNQIVNLFNVHLQSGHLKRQDDVRFKQIDEIYEYVVNNVSQKENVIITGDFNANQKLWKYIDDKFADYIDPFIDSMLNDIYTFKRFGTNEVQRFDGFLYYLPNLEYVDIKSVVDPIKIEKIGYFEQISDHYAIITDIVEV